MFPDNTPRFDRASSSINIRLGLTALLLCGAGALAAESSLRQSAGLPLDSARFLVNGESKLRGLFAGEVLLDAVSIAEGTFTLEEGTIHQIAAVRVSARRDGAWRVLSDEELVDGKGPARIVCGRDVSPAPTSAIDALGGYAVSSLLASDGSTDVRIDVLFPMGLKDDRPGALDRTPEALLVGPAPSGPITLAAIVAGDIDDPILAEQAIEVHPDAVRAGLSGVAILVDDDDRATPIAMVGYDLDEFGAEAGVIGWRLEVPSGVRASFKLLGTGESLTDMLASADEGDIALAILSGGGGSGWGFGGSSSGAFGGALLGGFAGSYAGGGGGGGAGGSRGRSGPTTNAPPAVGNPLSVPPSPPAGTPFMSPPDPPEDPPVTFVPEIPAPGTLALFALSPLGGGGRRRG